MVIIKYKLGCSDDFRRAKFRHALILERLFQFEVIPVDGDGIAIVFAE